MFLLSCLFSEQFCKPGSVSDGYLSRPFVTKRLKPLVGNVEQTFCSLGLLRVGFTREFSYHHPCALLPHISTIAKTIWHLFSVALSLESLPPAVSRHPCSMEPGLSSRTNRARNRLNYSRFTFYTP